MEHKILSLATTLDTAASNASSIEQLSKMHSISLEDAYSIQKSSIDLRKGRGENLCGYKLGFTSKAKMEQMGVHNIIWGRLTDAMSIENGGSMEMSKFIHPRVEPEIAFRICKTIDRPLVIEDIRKYVDGVAPALEIIDSRYANFKFSLEDVIADNCSSSAFVVGKWHGLDIDIRNLDIKLKINDKVVQTGTSDAILGNPWVSLVELSRMTKKYNFSVRPGHLVLAGAATSAVYLNENDRIEAEFESLKKVMFKAL